MVELYGAFCLFILAFLVLVFIGLPIGISLGAVGVIGFFTLLSPGERMQIGNICLDLTTSETLIVIPMFILMGQIISVCNIAEDFYKAVYKWLYWVPGSLAACSTITAAGFSAISGSSTAAAATIGSVCIPPMLKRNYSKRLACGVVTSGGALGILIPPSLGFIIYGFLTQTSIPKLFIAGIVPGVLITAFMVAGSIIGACVRPSLAPEPEKPSWEERWKALPLATPLLVLASLVSVFLYFGIATVTEVAALGVVAALLIGFVLRRLTLAKFSKILLVTVRITGMIVLIVIGGVILSFVFTSIGIPHKLAKDLSSLSINPWVILIATNVLFLVLGCFLDAICIQVVTIPFIFPVIMNLGIDPVWFGVIVIINMEMGLLTPPVGVNLFALAGVVDSRVSKKDIIVGSLYFEGFLALGLIATLLFPQIALWLPRNVG
jgi:C4-dicarboxylate transporter DctM subunit